MSKREEEKKATGFIIAEKFFGLITLIIGILTFYYTYSSLNSIADVGPKVALFVQVFMYAVSIGLIGLGIFLMLTRAS
ncbi:MAG TPA: hypothetical protein ENF63_00395 [Candidatus Bathyarchaeota archaeon]|nr:hypothetical protein [Candidatus Bathyarchaeota archaeon]